MGWAIRPFMESILGGEVMYRFLGGRRSCPRRWERSAGGLQSSIAPLEGSAGFDLSEDSNDGKDVNDVTSLGRFTEQMASSSPRNKFAENQTNKSLLQCFEERLIKRHIWFFVSVVQLAYNTLAVPVRACVCLSLLSTIHWSVRSANNEPFVI